MVLVLVESMERHGHLQLVAEVRTRLLAMSAATIDRALRVARGQRASGWAAPPSTQGLSVHLGPARGVKPRTNHGELKLPLALLPVSASGSKQAEFAARRSCRVIRTDALIVTFNALRRHRCDRNHRPELRGILFESGLSHGWYVYAALGYRLWCACRERRIAVRG